MKLKSTEPVEFKTFSELENLSKTYQSTQLCKTKCNFCENKITRELWDFLKRGDVAPKCKIHKNWPLKERGVFNL